MFPMFNFFCSLTFCHHSFVSSLPSSHNNKRPLRYSCEIRDLKSTYSLKTYNIRRLESKQFETISFFPLPWFYSPLIATTEGWPQSPTQLPGHSMWDVGWTKWQWDTFS
jgi:hypothetical protein